MEDGDRDATPARKRLVIKRTAPAMKAGVSKQA